MASAVERVEERLRRLYGAAPLVADGVVHVAAVWQAPAGRLLTLRITASTPRSETDFFVLNWARARADAIVTTGRILREEPALRHALQGACAPALQAWRRERAGRRAPARSVVLSSGRGVDLRHPVFAGGATTLITGEAGAAALAGRPLPPGVEVVARERPGLRDTVTFLRERGHRCLAIEAGPSASQELYRGELLVDELLLSVYEGPALPEALRGGALPRLERLDRLFGGPPSHRRLHEPSGPWSFRRWRRAPG